MAELQFAAFSDIIRDPWVTDERTYETFFGSACSLDQRIINPLYRPLTNMNDSSCELVAVSLVCIYFP